MPSVVVRDQGWQKYNSKTKKQNFVETNFFFKKTILHGSNFLKERIFEDCSPTLALANLIFPILTPKISGLFW
jgi:hypothetical protein